MRMLKQAFPASDADAKGLLCGGGVVMKMWFADAGTDIEPETLMMLGEKALYLHVSDMTLSPYEPIVQEMDEITAQHAVYDANPGPGEVPLAATLAWMGMWDLVASLDVNKAIHLTFLKVLTHERPIHKMLPGYVLAKELPETTPGQLNWPPRRMGGGGGGGMGAWQRCRPTWARSRRWRPSA